MQIQLEQTKEVARPARKVISTTDLRRFLDDAYRQARARPCPFCHVPLPYFWEPRDGRGENWRIGAPWKCSNGCHTVIAAEAVKLAQLYNVRPPLKT